MNSLLFSLRGLRRGWRSGDIIVLVLAIAVAVGASSAVSLFTDRVRLAMQQQSGETIAADLLLSLRDELDPERQTIVDQSGLTSATTVVFPSVALAGDEAALVSVKAVSDAYPLRGKLLIKMHNAAQAEQQFSGPSQGQVWVESRVLNDLGITVGEYLELGDSRFVVAAELLEEPDRGANFATLAPRVIMPIEQLPATGLLSEGSRSNWAVLLAGDADQLNDFEEQFRAKLKLGEKLENPGQARPALQQALDRGEVFLDLAALITVIMSGLALALAAQQHAKRRYDEVALVKTLGAKKGFLRSTLIWQLLVLGLLGSGMGLVLGFIGQQTIVLLVASVFDTPFPAPRFEAIVPSLIMGLVLLAGFAWPSLSQVLDAPPARVFRQGGSETLWQKRTATATALATVVALVIWQTANAQLSALVLLGSALVVMLLWLMSWLLLRLLRRSQTAARSKSLVWQFGINAVLRHPQNSMMLVVVFGTGLSMLFVLGLVRNDLLSGWQSEISQQAPNRFLINIAPDQTEAVSAFLAEQSAGEVPLFPMVRARLVTVAGKPATVENFERASELLNREVNLSWTNEMQPQNVLLEGQWWVEDDYGKALISIESSLQKRLGVALGDIVELDVAGQRFSATIHSVREVKWDAMTANFYILMPPQFLNNYPATYISAVHVSEGQGAWITDLIRTFPNISVINITSILAQIKSIAERVSQAIELVFAFTLLAGLLIQMAAINSSKAERLAETAVMRTLGANSRLLRGALWVEFIVLGFLASLVAAVMAQLIAIPIAGLLDLPWTINWVAWLAAIGLATLLMGFLGVANVRDVLKHPPMASLRG